VEPERGFLELGLTSLGAVELRNSLSAVTGLALHATVMFDHPTASALARHLLERLTGQSTSPTAAPVLRQLDEMAERLSELDPHEDMAATVTARLRALLAGWTDRQAAGSPADTFDFEAATAGEMFEFINKDLGLS
jgi:hypothetical protein